MFRRRTFRTGASFVALAGVLALSLTVPIPSLPDQGEASVVRVVRERLPGWSVEHIDRSWENAFVVVTACADREMGFQVRPGLAPGSAWLNPSDAFTRERLASVSDHWRELVWYGDPAIAATLSCEEELAGGSEMASEASAFD
jgi:hypothetical protein